MSLAAISIGGPGSVKLPRSKAPIVKADQLLFVHFERPNLEQAEQYLGDFGLVVTERSQHDLFMRGAGPQPYIYHATQGPNARFLGLGLSVTTNEDLRKLATAFGCRIEVNRSRKAWGEAAKISAAASGMAATVQRFQDHNR